VRVTIDGRDVPVAYAGPAPGLPNGMFQLNLQLPPDLASGTLPILVTVNGQTSPKGATLRFANVLLLATASLHAAVLFEPDRGQVEGRIEYVAHKLRTHMESVR
jgi:hypothetical protein